MLEENSANRTDTTMEQRIFPKKKDGIGNGGRVGSRFPVRLGFAVVDRERPVPMIERQFEILEKAGLTQKANSVRVHAVGERRINAERQALGW